VGFFTTTGLYRPLKRSFGFPRGIIIACPYFLIFDALPPLVDFPVVIVNILLGYVKAEGIFVSLFEVAILVFQTR